MTIVGQKQNTRSFCPSDRPRRPLILNTSAFLLQYREHCQPILNRELDLISPPGKTCQWVHEPKWQLEPMWLEPGAPERCLRSIQSPCQNLFFRSSHFKNRWRHLDFFVSDRSLVSVCFCFLLAAAWIDSGRNVLESAEQRCQGRYSRIHRVGNTSNTQNKYMNKATCFVCHTCTTMRSWNLDDFLLKMKWERGQLQTYVRACWFWFRCLWPFSGQSSTHDIWLSGTMTAW